MGIEYRIQFEVRADFNPQTLLRKLPSPIHRESMREIYTYKIESDGFYFLDALVDRQVASLAFRLFVDAALNHAGVVKIIEA